MDHVEVERKAITALISLTVLQYLDLAISFFVTWDNASVKVLAGPGQNESG